jgi:PIN domain nuclease of toxin-antitoxin system
MRFLIDTNILIFSLCSQEHFIDKNVTAILEDYENTIYVSSSSVFEALHLHQSGRIKTKTKVLVSLFMFLKSNLLYCIPKQSISIHFRNSPMYQATTTR